MTRPARILCGGILAAGEGSRLRRDGWDLAKPLVPVAGVALVEHAIANFLAAGVERIAIIFNESEEDCVRFVRSRFEGVALDVFRKTTASSFASLRALSARLPSGPALFGTVDAWCPREDFVRFAAQARAFSDDATVLAVTPFVDDERPLWLRRGGGGRIVALGGAEGDAVTAGAYLLSSRARERAEAPGPSHARLREFLAALVSSDEPVFSVEIREVVDVDRSRDVALANDFARRERERDALP
jgi:NDP-sugar pyrophosphorylase family protein